MTIREKRQTQTTKRQSDELKAKIEALEVKAQEAKEDAKRSMTSGWANCVASIRKARPS
jgi:hypothetical protein